MFKTFMSRMRQRMNTRSVVFRDKQKLYLIMLGAEIDATDAIRVKEAINKWRTNPDDAALVMCLPRTVRVIPINTKYSFNVEI